MWNKESGNLFPDHLSLPCNGDGGGLGPTTPCQDAHLLLPSPTIIPSSVRSALLCYSPLAASSSFPSTPSVLFEHYIVNSKAVTVNTKNTEKIQNWPKNGNSWPVFVIFRYFFCIFGGQPGVGDFVIFRVFFFVVSHGNHPHLHFIFAKEKSPKNAIARGVV